MAKNTYITEIKVEVKAKNKEDAAKEIADAINSGYCFARAEDGKLYIEGKEAKLKTVKKSKNTKKTVKNDKKEEKSIKNNKKKDSKKKTEKTEKKDTKKSKDDSIWDEDIKEYNPK